MLLPGNSLQLYRLWRNGWWYSSKFQSKESGIAILIPEKTDFEPKKKQETKMDGTHNDKEWIIHQEYITVFNIYAHNIGVPKYINSTNSLKREILTTTQ